MPLEPASISAADYASMVGVQASVKAGVKRVEDIAPISPLALKMMWASKTISKSR